MKVIGRLAVLEAKLVVIEICFLVGFADGGEFVDPLVTLLGGEFI